MRVLIIKLTSMGDVIHVLPAITDASNAIPEIEFDFVVEESFQQIPAWHNNVQQIIPVASRRWRKNIVSSKRQIFSVIKQIRSKNYDLIIDAQGLGKSALIAFLAKGQRHGYDKESIRESFASYFYQKGHKVDKKLHAIDRIRTLFAHSLHYEVDFAELNYGISTKQFPESVLFSDELQQRIQKPYYMFLHGTTWKAKEWPEASWIDLARKIQDQNQQVFIPWGNDLELARAKRIAKTIQNAYVLPKLSIAEIGRLIAMAKAIVAVDTGFGHLSAALAKPTINIYGPTDTNLIGSRGLNQVHLCANDHPNWQAIKKNESFDYARISADLVFDRLQQQDSA